MCRARTFPTKYCVLHFRQNRQPESPNPIRGKNGNRLWLPSPRTESGSVRSRHPGDAERSEKAKDGLGQG
jgi:hypothetical protein